VADAANPTDQAQHLLARQAAMLAQLPAEKQAHFLHLLDLLLDCYTTEATRALVLTTSGVGEKETVSLLAINADEQETDELIDTLCVFRKLDFQDDAPVLN